MEEDIRLEGWVFQIIGGIGWYCVESDRRSIERPEAAVSYAYICAYIRIYIHIYMHSESQCSFSFE